MNDTSRLKFWLRRIAKGFLWIFGVFMLSGILVFAENWLGFHNGPFQKISDSIQQALNPSSPPSPPVKPNPSNPPLPEIFEADGCRACGMG